ncbi:MAG: zinc ribbon domain-containing protein [Desulfobacterales bacterium]|nr:zinc ribbon domain-containing protein [Deltaproteobacteria bacterium]MBT8360200.1 zinc ribbon domain-containing protein [Deltaproteobacteria bacterium]NNK97255.1 zinc ribbon domain-containing protein [Desulfobacterales bacterium]
MPIYEFICSDCGEEFETILSSADTSSVVCSGCQSSQVKKVMSSGSFRLKSGTSSLPTCPSTGAACGNPGFS